MPYVNIDYPKTYVECIDGEEHCYYHDKDENGLFKYDYDNLLIKAQHLTPKIFDNLNNGSKELLSKENFYANLKLNQEPFITTITSFDIDNFTNQESISIMGNSETLYASNKSIYIVSQEYPIYFNLKDYEQRSTIYKFSIENNLTYMGKTFIDGHILNQFSLSEYKDILRVASTIEDRNSKNIDNVISTISQDSDNLELIGELKGLGLDGEKIKGVRFLGDRGFIETFREDNPLYTIDLSKPKNPQKIGELKIAGYSSYFHPIDENRILSIGRDSAIQIQLFDISDFANPILADKVLIGDSMTYSEAESNHKAFTYRESDSLFSLPINTYFVNFPDNRPPDLPIYINSLNIYQVDGLKIKTIDKIDGGVTKNNNYNYQRGIIFSNNNIDYGLYIAGGELFLKEINSTTP